MNQVLLIGTMSYERKSNRWFFSNETTKGLIPLCVGDKMRENIDKYAGDSIEFLCGIKGTLENENGQIRVVVTSISFINNQK